MTTWELPQGYGRMKPDILTLGESVFSTSHDGDCKVLSGTSVASPVVTGAVSALVSLAKIKKPHLQCNPAMLKQLITHTATPLLSTSMYEQGSGVMSAKKASEYLLKYEPHASIHPPRLNLSDCSYTWPHCKMPLYYTSRPLILNLTILNPKSVSSRVEETVWVTQSEHHQKLINVDIEVSDVLWPWSGWIAISITSNSEVKKDTLIVGTLKCYLSDSLDTPAEVVLVIPLIKSPPRDKRILWDLYHNMQYPPHYVARDDLSVMGDALDWNGDHPHTNYRDAFNFLTSQGYYVEILSDDCTTFDGTLYSAILLIDVEDEFTNEEISKLTTDVNTHGLGIIIFADWYNKDIMKKSSFRDDNTREIWHPIVGGSNIPSLNKLLKPHGIALGNSVWHGHLPSLSSRQTSILYGSGTSIAKFPAGGTIIRSVDNLNDVEKIFKSPSKVRSKLFATTTRGTGGVPILGFYKRIAVFGDSTCIDSAHNVLGRFCFNILKAMMDFVVDQKYRVASEFKGSVLLQKPFVDSEVEILIGEGLVQQNTSHSLHGKADRRGHDHLLKPAKGTVVRPVKSISVSPHRWEWHHEISPIDNSARDPIVVISSAHQFDFKKVPIMLPMTISFVMIIFMVTRVVKLCRKRKPILADRRRRGV